MENTSKNRRRPSLRLKGIDYSLPGSYYVTICSHQRMRIFGDVTLGEVHLSPAGEAVRNVWLDLPGRFPRVVCLELVVMPNHLHGVLALTSPIHEKDKGAVSSAPASEHRGFRNAGLPEIIRAFKSLSAIRVNQILGRRGVPVWQRNYYEHIIRDEKGFGQIREYILRNPERWNWDPENI